ncbi:MAG: nitrile hydratase accessory protein [Leptolyngbya sp. SIO1E4]|nr:nitrile hydratase accessory protein [Leptolyngbya sp. SIO1E4]
MSLQFSQEPLTDGLNDASPEPVFQAPWEATAFAIVNQLASDRHYSWAEWVDQFTQEIALAESDANDTRTYYERWVDACEKLLIDKGLLDAQAIHQKIADLIRERETDHHQ